MRSNDFPRWPMATLLGVILFGGLFIMSMADQPTYKDLQSQLTQRTAELEAAKHCYADLLAKYQNLVAWYDKQNGTPCEQVRHKQEVADLQAELERVRGFIAEYAKAKTDFDEKRLQEDHYAGKERYNRLVEAENALLQHRQGMEG